jgi:hypothetical protein
LKEGLLSLSSKSPFGTGDRVCKNEAVFVAFALRDFVSAHGLYQAIMPESLKRLKGINLTKNARYLKLTPYDA